MQQFLSHVQNFLWGPGMLVLLLGTGLWLSWKSWFLTVLLWKLRRIWAISWLRSFTKENGSHRFVKQHRHLSRAHRSM